MSSIAFVAEMKLRRLRELRDVLRADYDRIEQEAAQQTEPSSRLQVLYDGLRSLEVTGHRLHPEVCNLDAVLLGASPALTAAWLERLERELACGRLRADVMYAYAALLGEWAGAKPSPPPADHGARVAALLARRDPTLDDAVIAEALRGFPAADFSSVDEDTDTGLLQMQVHTALERVAGDPEKKAELRDEARRFSADGDLKKDLTDALALLLEDVDAWKWPAALPLRSVWTGDRHRLHIDEDLVTAVLLDVVASRFSSVVSEHLRGGLANRMQRLQRLRELDAPAIIIENEERMLAEAKGGILLDSAFRETKNPPHGSSVVVQRSSALGELMNAGLRASSYGGEYGTALRTLLFIVDAEVALGRPLALAKTDIQDFFPSVSHELVLQVCAAFGVPEGWCSFFSRYLDAHPGLPLGHDLSRLFGEMLLAVVEREVRKDRPGLRVARLVDDIVLWSTSGDELRAGFLRLQQLVTAMGLTLSRDKTGAVGVGLTLPAGLPDPLRTGAFRLGSLELQNDGTWKTSDAAGEEAAVLARKKIGEATSVLDAVSVANTHVRRFVASLVPSAPLGPGHLARAAACITRFQDSLFAGGLDGHLRRAVSKMAPGPWIDEVPAAWLHWPLTAGGLGLVDGHVELAPWAKKKEAAAAAASSLAGSPPADVETGDHAWSRLYAARLTPREPEPPDANPLTDGLAADFVKRKSEMRGAPAPSPSSSSSTELAPYWRWVLSTHGPDIIASFGSYRFLLHQLLPIHLIQSRRFHKSANVVADDIPF